MEKPLHIQLLEHLKQIGAFIHEVDIKPHFLPVLQTFEERTEFNTALRHLHNIGFIYTNSDGIQYGNIDDVEITASIQPKGEQYLKSIEDTQATYNLPNSNNVIIAQHSSLDNMNQAQHSPINSPIPKATKSHRYKSIRLIVIGVVVGLIVLFLTIWLKGCGVSAQIIIHR